MVLYKYTPPFFFHAHSAVIRIGEKGIYHRDDIQSAVWLAGYEAICICAI